MRVCYIIECMYNSGGMERVLSVCANALCLYIDVSILTIYQNGRACYFPLDDRIHLYDLNLKNVSDKKQLRVQMYEFITSNHFDIVISLGGIDMYYLHSIKDGSKKIVWFHFAIDIAKTSWVGLNPSLKRKAKAQLQTYKRVYHARKYDKIVVLSDADLKKWNRYTNKAEHIYNPITIECNIKADLNAKSVVSVGRLDYQKGFDMLIDAWKMVYDKHPEWQLNIYGEGSLRDDIQKQIDRYCLSKVVHLHGRVTNINEKLSDNSIYVMSSRAEGFPLVLLEASACGLPLVSYNCPSGPNEIIENGRNGILVNRVGDINGLADAICRLMDMPELRHQMGKQALIMVEKFSINNIMSMWLRLFDKVSTKNDKNMFPLNTDRHDFKA